MSLGEIIKYDMKEKISGIYTAMKSRVIRYIADNIISDKLKLPIYAAITLRGFTEEDGIPNKGGIFLEERIPLEEIFAGNKPTDGNAITDSNGI